MQKHRTFFVRKGWGLALGTGACIEIVIAVNNKSVYLASLRVFFHR